MHLQRVGPIFTFRFTIILPSGIAFNFDTFNSFPTVDNSEAFVDSADQDQTAQNVQSYL